MFDAVWTFTEENIAIGVQSSFGEANFTGLRWFSVSLRFHSPCFGFLPEVALGYGGSAESIRR